MQVKDVGILRNRGLVNSLRRSEETIACVDSLVVKGYILTEDIVGLENPRSVRDFNRSIVGFDLTRSRTATIARLVVLDKVFLRPPLTHLRSTSTVTQIGKHSHPCPLSGVQLCDNLSLAVEYFHQLRGTSLTTLSSNTQGIHTSGSRRGEDRIVHQLSKQVGLDGVKLEDIEIVDQTSRADIATHTNDDTALRILRINKLSHATQLTCLLLYVGRNLSRRCSLEGIALSRTNVKVNCKVTQTIRLKISLEDMVACTRPELRDDLVYSRANTGCKTCLINNLTKGACSVEVLNLVD